MDPDKGRKAIGGKIEVKLRIREPLTDKDVEILTQKWLVIEAFVAPSNRVSRFIHIGNGEAFCCTYYLYKRRSIYTRNVI